MVGYRWHVKRYFAFRKEEWRDLLITAAAAGFIFSFNDWGESTVELLNGVGNLVKDFILAFVLLTFMLVAWKLAGVRFGFQVVYEKYALGLLLGVFVAFLSFGYVPFFITGRLEYKVIHNLRIGHFRATMGKNWEMGLTAAAGPLAMVLLTVLLNALGLLTGLHLFREAIVMSILITLYTILPLPLIETANPYTVYMSRLESLRGNLPGYDLFIASRTWYAFGLGMLIVFTLLALVFQASLFVLIISILLGFLSMFLYTKARLHFA